LFLGEVEKNWTILLALAEVDLTKVLPPFSVGEKDGHGVGGELLRALDSRRGMAKGMLESRRIWEFSSSISEREEEEYVLAQVNSNWGVAV
jgi:hypothetical protein